ncbi:hypothetical protein Fmac_006152 [Flemingia macrophylla]|uniref:5'-3' exonuclease domain-containing protein n=1 Tax=Flemingia macrophylla TaxID=520843 RepID=A0ABD1NAZ3_9FABA
MPLLPKQQILRMACCYKYHYLFLNSHSSLWRKLPLPRHGLRRTATARSFYHSRNLHTPTLLRSSRALVTKGYCGAASDSPRATATLVPDAGFGTVQSLQQLDSVADAEHAANNEPLNGRVMIVDELCCSLFWLVLAKLHHGHLTHADGNGDWVLTIFTALSLIIDVLEFIPSHVVVVFDHDGQNFRHNLYPAYKSNRPPTPDTIVQGLQYFKASIKAMSIKVPGVEADDVIGTLSLRSVDAGYKVRVVSPDKDFFQILSPSLRLLRIAPRGDQMVSFGVEDFAKRYGGLKPSQFVDVIALSGDRSDNIPGVNGIGDVHAVQLISKFGFSSSVRFNGKACSDNGIMRSQYSDSPKSKVSWEGKQTQLINLSGTPMLDNAGRSPALLNAALSVYLLFFFFKSPRFCAVFSASIVGITSFCTLERLLKSVDQVKEDRIRKALIENAEQALLSKELASISI